MEKQRNQALDFFRILAAFGVVTIHVKSISQSFGILQQIFASYCVPFFYMGSIFFFIKSLPHLSVVDFCKKITFRLVVPYLSWTLVFFGLLMLKNYIFHQNKTFDWAAIFLYGNSAVQLYFLPNLIIIQCMLYFIYLFTQNDKKNYSFAFILLLIVSSFYYFAFKNNYYGVGNWEHILYYLIYGAISLWLIKSKEFTSSKKILIISGVIWIVSMSLFATKHYLLLSSFSLVYVLAGSSSFIWAYYSNYNFKNSVLLTLLLYSFGIYLCHPIFIELLELSNQLIFKFDFGRLFTSTMIFTSIVFICSAIFIFFLKKYKVLSKIFLGE